MKHDSLIAEAEALGKELATIRKTQEFHAAAFNRLQSRTPGPSGITYSGTNYAAGFDAETSEIARLFAATAPRTPGTGFDDPEFAALTSQMFQVAIKVQRGRATPSDHERLAKIEKAFGGETAAALVTSTDSLGGFLIPSPVAAELYRMMLDASIIAAKATHVPMTALTLALPTEGSSSLSVEWSTDETANITDSVPASNAVAKVTLTARRIQGWGVCSLDELQDSAVAILSWIQTKLVEMAGREIDRVLLEGVVGVAPLVAGLRSATGVNDMGVTDTINGDQITYARLVAQVFKARERSSRDGARWMTSPEVMAKIVGLVDDQKQPVVQFGNVPSAFAASILGFPVDVHSVIKADRTYGTGGTCSSLYFGPPKQLVIGDRMGMAFDVSDQANFQKAQISMRLLARVGLGIAVPAAFTRKNAVSLI